VITERDREILRLINRFGYLTAAQVAKLMGMSKRMTYLRLQRMVQKRYLNHRRVLFGQAGIYRCSARGLEEIEAELGRFPARLQTLPHNLAVADVAAALLERYPGSEWITERELRREAGQKFGVGANVHVPDGVLVLANREKIAVEYENTTKAKATLNKILRDYLRKSEYYEVWFICRTARQAERYKKLTRGYDFVKVFCSEDVLAAEGSRTAQEAL
jgi:hypothetical protein